MMPATKTPLLTLFGMPNKAPSGDQLGIVKTLHQSGLHTPDQQTFGVPESAEPARIRGIDERVSDLRDERPV